MNKTIWNQLNPLASNNNEKADRGVTEEEAVLQQLRKLEAFRNFSADLLNELGYFSYSEEVEGGIVLFHQGDVSTNWYVLIHGSVDVIISVHDEASQNSRQLKLLSLKVGDFFGESIAAPTNAASDQLSPETSQQRNAGQDVLHSTSAVTAEDFVQLLRISTGDFQELLKRYAAELQSAVVGLRELAEDFIAENKDRFTPQTTLLNRHGSAFRGFVSGSTHSKRNGIGQTRKQSYENVGNRIANGHVLAKRSLDGQFNFHSNQLPSSFNNNGYQPANNSNYPADGLLAIAVANSNSNHLTTSNYPARSIPPSLASVELPFSYSSAFLASPGAAYRLQGDCHLDSSYQQARHNPYSNEAVIERIRQILAYHGLNEVSTSEAVNIEVEPETMKSAIFSLSRSNSEKKKQQVLITANGSSNGMAGKQNVIPGNYSYMLPLFHHGANSPRLTPGTERRQNRRWDFSLRSAKSARTKWSSSGGCDPGSPMADYVRQTSSPISATNPIGSTGNISVESCPVQNLPREQNYAGTTPPTARRNSVLTGKLDFRRPADRAALAQNSGLRRGSDDTFLLSPEALAKLSLNSIASPRLKIAHSGFVLRTVMLANSPEMIRDRKMQMIVFQRSMIGKEMVDWLLANAGDIVTSRQQAVGVWQALLEEGIITHVTNEYNFLDHFLFYRWTTETQGVSRISPLAATPDEKDQQDGKRDVATPRLPKGLDEAIQGAPSSNTGPTEEHKKVALAEFNNVLNYLTQIGPDALFRMILQKPPHQRTAEDLEIIFEELLHINALSHLSTMVKRELAGVLMYEQHQNAGTILFNQGDEGKSWYIVLRGSVNVVIYGKGVVCTLHEGDDFGKLALVNNSARAATIQLNEDNCQFLRVDKDDFNRILRDVEANTLRLKEHNRDVLVLEKIPIKKTDLPAGQPTEHRYSVMAGSPEKMLEYLLETRIDSVKDECYRSDTFLEDFLFTHLIFMPVNVLCASLKDYYRQSCSPSPGSGGFSMPDANLNQSSDFMQTAKRRVVSFVQTWADIVGSAFYQDSVAAGFIEELFWAVLEDSKSTKAAGVDCFKRELTIMQQLRHNRDEAMQAFTRKPIVVMDCGVLRQDRQDFGYRMPPILPFDLCIFKVHSSDQTYTTLKTRIDHTISQICKDAAHKLDISKPEHVELVEVRSNGEKIIFRPDETSLATMLSLNGRVFIVPRDKIESLIPLPEQAGPLESVHTATLELISSNELAAYLAQFHWELFSNTHEYEFIYQVIGRDKFGPNRLPSNLDILMRRFNEVQFFAVTEVVLCHNLAKRVNLVKKLIKIAALSKDYQDLLSFFAIILGLSNVGVSRLSSTWEKLPGKTRKQFLDFESYLDPSRNHRAYRLMIAKMHPPIIPFVPLLMKDLTFTHEGNKTYFDGLVNFEKMHMIAQTLRTVRHCKSSPFLIESTGVKKSVEVQELIRNFRVIDGQRRLAQLSQKLEPRKSSAQRSGD